MLCDQDDFWPKGRIEYMLNILRFNKNIDLLFGDFKLVDYKILKNYEDQFQINFNTGKLKKLTLRDFIFKKYPFYGCCMAFKSEILEDILPFPKWIDAHDRWIAINSIINNSAYFLNKIVTFRGRHNNNQTRGNRKFLKRLKSFFKKLSMVAFSMLRKNFLLKN